MEKINIAELLKDCPSGMELDCTMYEDCKFLDIDAIYNSYLIRITTPCGIKYLDKYGCYTIHDKAKCVIFPKGKTTWDGFQRPFINGDVIVDKTGAIVIYKQVHNSYEDPIIDFHCRLTSANKGLFQINGIGSLSHCWEIDSARFATEEEKAKLFQAIKDNSYNWNAETKTLEKIKTCLNCEVFKEMHQNCPYSPIWNYKNLKEATSHLSDETNCEFWTKIPRTKTLEKTEPKFKAGNIIKDIRNNSQGIILKITNDGYECYFETGKFLVNFKEQDYFELVPNKFNINTLKPFDKVLVRCADGGSWNPQFFAKYRPGSNFPFVCTYNTWSQCIPYEVTNIY